MLTRPSQWARDAERYTYGAPTMLLGLKADLRRPLPSLRLSHLVELTQTSRGQASVPAPSTPIRLFHPQANASTHRDQAEHLALKMGMEAQYEASAKTGEGVDGFFEATIRGALKRRRANRGQVPMSRTKKAWEAFKRQF